ncbi:hypothetical protein Ahy_B06g083938 isoform B [Arachis hypogaea]|uniref:Dynamin-type G domain-containing protein n=1 Tax=Arachis hypogaea TaxID=3818 RepID=A0A444YQM9_ARAHY|nr:hypothetical protein Ahy_B06g083938 isoform B [Arachis hypogaea]
MNGGVDIYLAIIPKKEVAKIKDKSTDQVFSMLDTSRLYHAVATCKLFRNWAKYPFCYSHIDLRTPVPKVNDALVTTIIHRAGKALSPSLRFIKYVLAITPVFSIEISGYVEHNDAILLVVIPASQEPEISTSRALRVAKEYDAESTRTVGVISKIDQAAAEPKALAASAASENSLETAWRAETESLKSILTGAPPNKLGRVALVESLAGQICNRMKLRLPILLTGR